MKGELAFEDGSEGKDGKSALDEAPVSFDPADYDEAEDDSKE